jgi:hypothetical protein
MYKKTFYFHTKKSRKYKEAELQGKRKSHKKAEDAKRQNCRRKAEVKQKKRNGNE